MKHPPYYNYTEILSKEDLCMTIIENKIFDAERALYGLSDAEIRSCRFAGPADGESALKECDRIHVISCLFELRYPFWHVRTGVVEDCTLTSGCRAAMWYDSSLTVKNSILGGVKALRECEKITLENVNADSVEFGWRCRELTIRNTSLKSEYPFFECRSMDIEGLNMTGKYSFQYAENAVIRSSVLNTKDAFWHSKNVTVYDSEVRGEYLGWYSENLRLVRCRISGTQPLCYAKGLILEDCTMENTDLSFEKSDVTATVNGNIDSVKNPMSGRITADAIGNIIREDGDCEIVIRRPEEING